MNAERNLEKSEGHLFFYYDFEYYQRGTKIFCAQIVNEFDVRTNQRIGWLACPMQMIGQLKVILGMEE